MTQFKSGETPSPSVAIKSADKSGYSPLNSNGFHHCSKKRTGRGATPYTTTSFYQMLLIDKQRVINQSHPDFQGCEWLPKRGGLVKRMLRRRRSISGRFGLSWVNRRRDRPYWSRVSPLSTHGRCHQHQLIITIAHSLMAKHVLIQKSVSSSAILSVCLMITVIQTLPSPPLARFTPHAK